MNRPPVNHPPVNRPTDASQSGWAWWPAEALRGNFYELLPDRQETELLLRQLNPLLAALWSEMPPEYTAGTSFEQWLAPEE